MRLRCILTLAGAALFVGSSAQAATISYGALLGGPGFFNGTGNPDGGFTLATEGNLAIGLRAKYRQNPNVINSATELYSVVTGTQTNVTSGGNGANASRAAWNYEFSVNVCVVEPGCTDVLANYLPNSTLTVTDMMNGFSHTVNFPYWADNSGWGPGGKHQPAVYATDWIMQNSQNAMFLDFPLNLAAGYPGFNPNNDGYYRFTINLRNALGNTVLNNFIDVQVGAGAAVPEPATLTLLGVGLAAGAARLRKRKKS